MDIIQEASLEQAVDALVGAIDRLESSSMVVKRFEGNICLSNPLYDLYVDSGQIALGETPSEQRDRLRRLMDFVPALDRPVSVQAVAGHIGLPEAQTLEYLRKWADKGLVSLL